MNSNHNIHGAAMLAATAVRKQRKLTIVNGDDKKKTTYTLGNKARSFGGAGAENLKDLDTKRL